MHNAPFSSSMERLSPNDTPCAAIMHRVNYLSSGCDSLEHHIGFELQAIRGHQDLRALWDPSRLFNCKAQCVESTARRGLLETRKKERENKRQS